jgi:hypothetical protein
MIGKILIAILAALAVAAAIVTLPDIKRYLKLRSM